MAAAVGPLAAELRIPRNAGSPQNNTDQQKLSCALSYQLSLSLLWLSPRRAYSIADVSIGVSCRPPIPKLIGKGTP